VSYNLDKQLLKLIVKRHFYMSFPQNNMLLKVYSRCYSPRFL